MTQIRRTPKREDKMRQADRERAAQPVIEPKQDKGPELSETPVIDNKQASGPVKQIIIDEKPDKPKAIAKAAKRLKKTKKTAKKVK